MEILFEFLADLVGELIGGLLKSPRIPRIVRTLIICVLLLPWAVLCVYLTVKLAKEDSAGAWLAGACALVIFGLLTIALVKIWGNRK